MPQSYPDGEAREKEHKHIPVPVTIILKKITEYPHTYLDIPMKNKLLMFQPTCTLSSVTSISAV